MATMHAPKAEDSRWVDERAQDASALIERFGADAVDWLDRFLADYVFEGEPLDQVMMEARRLGELPSRPARSFEDEDAGVAG